MTNRTTHIKDHSTFLCPSPTNLFSCLFVRFFKKAGLATSLPLSNAFTLVFIEVNSHMDEDVSSPILSNVKMTMVSMGAMPFLPHILQGIVVRG